MSVVAIARPAFKAPDFWMHILTGLATIGMCLVVAGRAHAETPRHDGWVLEPGVDGPSYAVTEPVHTNLNVDTVALVCEEAGNGRIVQLQLYLTDDGPLAPNGVPSSALKPLPRVTVAIDRQAFPANLYFAADYVLVADSERERHPMLSQALLEAMAKGRSMTLRFDLASRPSNPPSDFDGEVRIDLQAGKGGQAVNAVRRCAEPPSQGDVTIAHAAD